MTATSKHKCIIENTIIGRHHELVINQHRTSQRNGVRIGPKEQNSMGSAPAGGFITYVCFVAEHGRAVGRQNQSVGLAIVLAGLGTRQTQRVAC